MILTYIRELMGLVFVLLMLSASLVAVKRWTKRPLSFAWPLSFGMVVITETVLLNLLSVGHMVSLYPVIISNLIVMMMWVRGVSIERAWSSICSVVCLIASKIHTWRVEWMIIPLGVMVLVTAFCYPPMTFDSMTYHMARVGHWVQNRSVEYYPTSIDRQNWVSPGAEYLILILQILSGSDRWANIVQFLAWIHILFAIPSLSRMAGVPSRLVPWCAVLVAAIPMGVMQASSTQTDMVASTLMVGIVIASLPFLHHPDRWRFGQVMVLVCMVCGGWLVKQTSLLVASSILFFVVVNCLYYKNKSGQLLVISKPILRKLIPMGFGAVVLSAVLIGPNIVRLMEYNHCLEYANSKANPRLWTFRLFGHWPERLINVVDATYAQHTVGRERVPVALRRLFEKAGVLAEIPRVKHDVFKLNEDFIGNPIHMAIFVILAIWVIVVWPWLPQRIRGFSIIPILSWIVLHMIIKDQVWISRLQLPFFVLIPIMWSAVFLGKRGMRLKTLLLAGTTLVALAYAYTCAANNGRKELTFNALYSFDREIFYYLNVDIDGRVRAVDDEIMKMMSRNDLKRLGLMIGFTSCEYPLLRRAMMQGIKVRHVLEPSDWPELIYSEKGTPRSLNSSIIWQPIGTNGIYYPVKMVRPLTVDEEDE
jgi:hypothetical protein